VEPESVPHPLAGLSVQLTPELLISLLMFARKLSEASAWVRSKSPEGAKVTAIGSTVTATESFLRPSATEATLTVAVHCAAKLAGAVYVTPVPVVAERDPQPLAGLMLQTSPELVMSLVSVPVIGRVWLGFRVCAVLGATETVIGFTVTCIDEVFVLSAAELAVMVAVHGAVSPASAGAP
jgi:hypothetical protein